MPNLYSRNAAALRAYARERNLPCVHCAVGIVWDAPARSRWAFAADHRTPKSLGGTDEYGNLQVSHYGCNSARGNGVTRGTGSHNGKHPSTPTVRNAQSERWP